MTIKPLTDRQQTMIVNNVVKALKDIDQLNKTGYNYLYLAAGFIAHYNMYGFKAHYQQHSLKRDLVNNMNPNMWTNFRPGDENYDYYMSKATVYKRILAAIGV